MFGQQPNPVRGSTQQVCTFYLKGQCKYGTQCWNLHPPNQAVGGMANTFGVSSNVFGAKTTTQPDTKEFAEFVKQLSGEMTQWERSGQWLLSSFTPLKSHPLLAGFSDHSPEEMRAKAYEALKTNTSSTYQEYWAKTQQQYKQLRDALKVPTPDAYQAMKDVFHAKGGEQQQNASQAAKPAGGFGKPSVFGATGTQPQTGAGLLGAKPQASLFGGGGSLFGANQQSGSVFGDSAKKSLFGGSGTLGNQSSASTFGTQQNSASTFGTQQSSASTFGTQQSSASTFGTQQPSASTFGTQQPSTTFGGGNSMFKSGASNSFASGGSIFGGPPKIQGNTLFGGGTATSSTAQNSGSIFGSSGATSTTPATGNIFGGGTSLASNAPASGNMFGGAIATTTSASSIFGGNTASSASGSIFGGGTNTSTTTPAAGSVFGGGQNQATGIFGGNTQASTTFGGMGSSASGSTFGNSNAAGVFGGANATGASTSLFGAKPSIFGGQQSQTQPQTSSLFGNTTPTNPSLFGGQPQAGDPQAQKPSSLFGGNATPTFGSTNPGVGTGLFGNASSTLSSNIFGTKEEPASSAAGLFGKQPESLPSQQQQTADNQLLLNTKLGNVKAEWFTPLDQLNLADKGQFEADCFTAIPLVPPPIELCI